MEKFHIIRSAKFGGFSQLLFSSFSSFLFLSLNISFRAPDFPESLHPVVYRILEKFEVLLSLKEFEREEEEQEEKEKELEEEGFVNPEFYDGESLVPSLLPDTSPEDTNSIWDTVARNAKMR